MKKIITNYLNDSISIVELEALKRWLQKSKNQEKFKEYVRLNNALNASSFQVDEYKAFQKISIQIKKKPIVVSKRFPNVLKYAALFIGVSLIGYGVYQNLTDTVKMPHAPQITLQLEDGSILIVTDNQSTIIVDSVGKKISEQNNNQLIYSEENTEPEVLRYNTLKVPYGKTFAVVLSDGSKVTLNAGSELKYPVQFIENEKNRNVFLNGEAFFEVAKNTDQPFIVNTQDMVVEVLGTHFNVTSYTEDDKTYTVLVEGKVAAHNKLSDTDSILLKPNERVFFEGNQLATENVNIQKYVAWVDGQLVFIDDSFKVITNKLERKYNLSIHNTYKDLDDIMITATFKNETIHQVLKTFQAYKAFDYTIKNGVVTISEPN